MAVKRTKRTSRGSARVKTSDRSEHLHYFITVSGSRGIFTLSCEHRDFVWRSSDFGPPKKNYDIVWPRTAADEDGSDDGYTFSMAFAAALKYTLRIEHHDSSHNLVKSSLVPTGVMKDIDYESEEAEEDFFEGYTVKTT
jgi:hypothetical protein